MTNPSIESWSIEGADGQAVLGNTHLPTGDGAGVILIAHGFKGYKDYGFIPYLADRAARDGLIAHRFNFSHSGMTNQIETFERPDLFERDTWGKQIQDLATVAAAVKAETIPGDAAALPTVWFGHSRGGVTALLAGWRCFAGDLDDLDPVKPAAIVAAASPDTTSHLDEGQRKLLMQQGWLESPSARTGQTLRISPNALIEIERNPSAFEPCEAVRHLPCPLLFVHGDDDQTVHPDTSKRMYEIAPQAELRVLAGATHTFNAPNPMDLAAVAPDQTRQMVNLVCGFAKAACTHR